MGKGQAQAPKLDVMGMSPSRGGRSNGSDRRTAAGGTMPSLEAPKAPTSRVKEQSIKIPDFFKK